jgi:hypothetical protein
VGAAAYPAVRWFGQWRRGLWTVSGVRGRRGARLFRARGFSRAGLWWEYRRCWQAITVQRSRGFSERVDMRGGRLVVTDAARDAIRRLCRSAGAVVVVAARRGACGAGRRWGVRDAPVGLNGRSVPKAFPRWPVRWPGWRRTGITNTRGCNGDGARQHPAERLAVRSPHARAGRGVHGGRTP